MRRLALAFVLLCLPLACGRAPSESGPASPANPSAMLASQPAGSPTLSVGPYGARMRACKHLITSFKVIWQDTETLRGPSGARPLEWWAALLQDDAQLLEQAGLTVAASQVIAFSDAILKLAQEVRRPAPANQDAAKKWGQRAARRRTQLLKAISVEVDPLLALCSTWMHGK